MQKSINTVFNVICMQNGQITEHATYCEKLQLISSISTE